MVKASQGDTRSNILQAPKVTLFNGQTAFVSDTTQTPFVISVIPVVGDFAAAQQPVIVVLNEGTFLTVQAVVSNDRRFVRLTVVPFFSKIGDVNDLHVLRLRSHHQLIAARHPDRRANDRHPPATPTNHDDHARASTVQLPTFSFVTVTTTVSVPDGGTVLLGGIKRLERRAQRIRRADLEQDPLHQPSVQERRHRPRNPKPDDDGHAADHHPGRGRRKTGHQPNDSVAAGISSAAETRPLSTTLGSAAASTKLAAAFLFESLHGGRDKSGLGETRAITFVGRSTSSKEGFVGVPARFLSLSLSPAAPLQLRAFA